MEQKDASSLLSFDVDVDQHGYLRVHSLGAFPLGFHFFSGFRFRWGRFVSPSISLLIRSSLNRARDPCRNADDAPRAINEVTSARTFRNWRSIPLSKLDRLTPATRNQPGTVEHENSEAPHQEL